MKIQQELKIVAHGEKLLKTFQLATCKHPIGLCKKLRRLEHTECPLPRDWGGYGLLAPEISEGQP